MKNTKHIVNSSFVESDNTFDIVECGDMVCKIQGLKANIVEIKTVERIVKDKGSDNYLSIGCDKCNSFTVYSGEAGIEKFNKEWRLMII